MGLPLKLSVLFVACLGGLFTARADGPDQAAAAPGPRRPHQGPAQQVLLAIKLVELDEEKLTRLGFDFAQLQPGGRIRHETTAGGLLAMRTAGPEANLPGVIESLRKNGLAKILGEPTLATTLGRPASVSIGAEIPLWKSGPDGQPVQRPERYGLAVDVVTHLVPGGNLRIDLRYEQSEVDGTRTEVVAGKENPGINRTVVDTRLEAKPGETVVVGGLVTRRSPPGPGEAKGSGRTVTFLLVTPQLVAPMAAVPISYN